MNELVFPSLNSSTNHNPTLLLPRKHANTNRNASRHPVPFFSPIHLQQNKQRISYHHQRNSGLLRVLHCLQRLQLNTE